MHTWPQQHFIKTRLNPFIRWSRVDRRAWPLALSVCRLPKPKPMLPRCKLKGKRRQWWPAWPNEGFDADLWSFCLDSLCHWSGPPQWEEEPGALVPLEMKCEAGAGLEGAWPLRGARLECLHHGKHMREDSLAKRIGTLSSTANDATSVMWCVWYRKSCCLSGMVI